MTGCHLDLPYLFPLGCRNETPCPLSRRHIRAFGTIGEVSRPLAERLAIRRDFHVFQIDWDKALSKNLSSKDRTKDIDNGLD